MLRPRKFVEILVGAATRRLFEDLGRGRVIHSTWCVKPPKRMLTLLVNEVKIAKFAMKCRIV